MSGQWKAYLGVLLVFVLGGVAGGLGSSAFFMHRNAIFLQRGAPAYLDVLERRLSRGVSLDADQKSRIHEIFMNNLEGRKRLQVQIQPQIQELNHETIQKVSAVLRPDQKTAFQENLAALHHKFARFGQANSRASDTDAAAGQGANSTNEAPAEQ